MKKILVTLLLSMLSYTYAMESYSEILSYSLGMVSHSVTPNESTLVSTDESTDASTATEEAIAASVSAISLNINYEFLPQSKKTYFLSGTLPLMTSEGTGVYSGAVGMNWYFGDLGTKYTYSLNGKSMSITPKSRYYWGALAGIGYVVYNSESAKYTDVFFDLGVHVGGAWGWGETKAIKVEVGAQRATGINTTGMKINILAGITTYI